MIDPQSVRMQGRKWHSDAGSDTFFFAVSFQSRLGRFQFVVSQEELALVEVHLEHEVHHEHEVAAQVGGWKGAVLGSRARGHRCEWKDHLWDSKAWVQVDRPLVCAEAPTPGGPAGDTELLRLIEKTVDQLTAYSQGRLREFDLPLKFTGTEFQNSVWMALMDIPYGQTTTYGQLAKRMGKPKGARAVGGALNRNPLGIVVPCHRVVGSDGSMVGFAGGIEVKKLLLELELQGKVG